MGLTTHVSAAVRTFQERASAATPGKTKRIVTTAAQVVAMTAATPQVHRASAATAFSALRRGADNEQWCCCHDDMSDNAAERQRSMCSRQRQHRGCGRPFASTPSVSCAVLLSHTSRYSLKFSWAREGGREGGGVRSAVRSGVRRVSEWAKALGREVCSPASWRCVPRRVSVWAKARRPGALSNFGRPGALLGTSVAFGPGCR